MEMGLSWMQKKQIQWICSRMCLLFPVPVLWRNETTSRKHSFRKTDPLPRQRHALKYLDENISSPRLMPLIPFNDSLENLLKHHDNDHLIFSLPTPVSLVTYRYCQNGKIGFQALRTTGILRSFYCDTFCPKWQFHNKRWKLETNAGTSLR